MNDGKLYRCRVAAQSDIPALLALINLAISIVLYFPFLKMYDNKLYAEEVAARESETETVAA